MCAHLVAVVQLDGLDLEVDAYGGSLLRVERVVREPGDFLLKII